MDVQPGRGLNGAPRLARRRVAVTGAGGFIGRHLVAGLAAAGAEVVDAGDGCSGEAGLERALAGCDSLVHLAYHPPGSRSLVLEEERRRNLVPTAGLLQAAAAAGVRQVCFASSTSVYGPGVDVSETFPAAGRTAYAAVKLAQEELIAGWAAAEDRIATILRLSTVYGPGESAHRAIPQFIQSALGGAPPVVSGRGLGPFDPVYVGDVVCAFALALAASASGVYNIGTGVPRAPVDVARLVLEITGWRLPVIHSRWEEDRGRPVCEVAGARAGFGFRAATPLEAGLREEVRWAGGAT